MKLEYIQTHFQLKSSGPSKEPWGTPSFDAGWLKSFSPILQVWSIMLTRRAAIIVSI